MRVLTVGNMYPPHHLGGYELMWRSAVAHLRDAGYEVRVLTSDHHSAAPDPTIPDQADAARELRWYWRDHDFPHKSPRERLALERHNARAFDRHVAELRPDAVSWWAMGGMSLSLIERARRAGLHSSAVVVDDWLLYGPEVDAWTCAFARRRRAAAVAGRLTGVPTAPRPAGSGDWLFASETLRERATEAGYSFERSAVAHPGIDSRLFAAAPRPEWRWRLLYCGRIDARKGIDVAIAALAELPPEATLTILGRGDEGHLTTLREQARDAGLQTRVQFESRPRERLPDAYAAADAVLFPVRWVEPFGLVPLEAMAVGAPVVASGRGGSGEYLRDGHNCSLFDVDTGPGALAAAIRELADSPARRRTLVEGGLETARRFDESGFNDAVAASIERAIGAG